MKTPTIEEIETFIRYKQSSWPDEFVKWIADKFFQHYQSCGWKLSSNVAMKDWNAAFCSRWQDLPYTDQRLKLEECRKKQVSIPTKTNLVSTDRTVEYVDDLLRQFKTGSYKWQDIGLPYKWLLENRLMTFSEAEVKKLVEDAGNNKEYGRYLSVKLFFSKLLANNMTFSDYISKKQAV